MNNPMKSLALYDLLTLLSGRYGAALLIASVAASVMVNLLSSTFQKVSLSDIVHSSLTLIAVFFALVFIIFVSYRHIRLMQYDYWSLFFSSLVVFFVSTLTIVVTRTVQSSDTFHAAPLVLSLVISVIAGAIFSGVLRLGQRIYVLVS